MKTYNTPILTVLSLPLDDILTISGLDQQKDISDLLTFDLP